MALIDVLIGPIASIIDKIIPDKEAQAKAKILRHRKMGKQHIILKQNPNPALGGGQGGDGDGLEGIAFHRVAEAEVIDREYVPSAVVMVLIDVDGLVLAVLDGRPTEYMLIDGVGPNLIAGATTAPEYRAAAQLAQSLPVELQPLVKNLGVGGSDSVTMTLTTGTLVKFGEPVDMRNKLVNVVVLLRRQDPNGLLEIDVSGGTPVVKSA